MMEQVNAYLLKLQFLVGFSTQPQKLCRPGIPAFILQLEKYPLQCYGYFRVLQNGTFKSKSYLNCDSTKVLSAVRLYLTEYKIYEGEIFCGPF